MIENRLRSTFEIVMVYVYELFAITRTHIRIKDLNKAIIRREAHSLSMRDINKQGQLMHYKLAEDFVNSFDKEK